MDTNALAGLLDELRRRHGVPGAQLALRCGEVVRTVSAGLADVHTGRPVDDDTAFAYGSATKPFAATLALQLVDDGDLDLDGPLAAHATGLRDAVDPALRAATLREALSHTAGFAGDYEVAGARRVPLGRYVSGLATLPAVRFPGARFSYSNAGYVVVGHAVEEVTGEPWEACVTRFVADPLGSTVAPLSSMDEARVATAYARRGADLVPVATMLPAGWAPAGGLAGSAADLVGLVEAHLGVGRSGLLDGRTAELMRTPAVGAEPYGVAAAWGLGWALYGGRSGRWFGHDGVLGGTTCAVRADPATGTVVALLTNATSGLALWPDLVAGLAPHGMDVADHPGVVPAAGSVVDPGRYVGEYVNGETVMTVRPDGAGLRLEDPTGFAARLVVHAGDVFEAHRLDVGQPPHAGRFLSSPGTGHVGAFQFSGRLAIRRAFGVA